MCRKKWLLNVCVLVTYKCYCVIFYLHFDQCTQILTGKDTVFCNTISIYYTLPHLHYTIFSISVTIISTIYYILLHVHIIIFDILPTSWS